MRDELKIEVIEKDSFGMQVHDVLESWQHADGDIVLWMTDHVKNQKLHMWITLCDAAIIRDYLNKLLKGTKFDPDQNIS